jgi:hypothetical protein
MTDPIKLLAYRIFDPSPARAAPKKPFDHARKVATAS